MGDLGIAMVILIAAAVIFVLLDGEAIPSANPGWPTLERATCQGSFLPPVELLPETSPFTPQPQPPGWVGVSFVIWEGVRTF